MHRRGFLDEAVEEYRAAVDADERLQQAWSNMGNIYAAQGHYDEAINSFKKALAIKREPLTLSAYASVLFSIGKTGEAVTLWQEALAVDPSFTSAAVNLAHALESSGMTAEAQEIRKRYGLVPPVRLPSGDYLTPDGKPLLRPGS